MMRAILLAIGAVLLSCAPQPKPAPFVFPVFHPAPFVGTVYAEAPAITSTMGGPATGWEAVTIQGR